MTVNQQIILASGSPRRRELLKLTGLDFETVSVDADEYIEVGTHPDEAVQCLAMRKAEMGLTDHPEALIIGADTVVALDDLILGKPADQDEAVHFLSMLSGKTHQVYTGVALVSDKIKETFVCCTDVRFFSLSDEEIAAYAASGEPLDKAGAYGIQGLGRFLVEEIRGNYDNVVGLPVAHLIKKLKALKLVTSEDLICG